MPKVRVKQSAKTEGFAIIGALLIVVAITIMVPQLVSITSEVQTGALKEHSRIKTGTISKTIYSSAHAQLIAHTGLPFAWETGTSFGSEPSRVDRAEACFVALYGDLSGAEASMTNWLTSFCEIFRDHLSTKYERQHYCIACQPSCSITALVRWLRPMKPTK